MGRKTSPFSMMADCADMRMTLSPTGSSVNAPTAKVLDEAEPVPLSSIKTVG
jgi:hypothetical protein